MSSQYIPLPTSFPSYALVDALAIVKAGGIDADGAKVLLRSGFELEGWALGAYLGHRNLVGAEYAQQPLTDDQAVQLMEGLVQPDPELEPGKVAFGLPTVACSPAVALKLAKWLIKAASIVIPILL